MTAARTDLHLSVVVAAMAPDPLPGRSLRPRALHKVLLHELRGVPDGTDDEGQE